MINDLRINLKTMRKKRECYRSRECPENLKSRERKAYRKLNYLRHLQVKDKSRSKVFFKKNKMLKRHKVVKTDNIVNFTKSLRRFFKKLVRYLIKALAFYILVYKCVRVNDFSYVKATWTKPDNWTYNLLKGKSAEPTLEWSEGGCDNWDDLSPNIKYTRD
jgi:hypothetical protein